jgi:hypothetical protein
LKFQVLVRAAQVHLFVTGSFLHVTAVTRHAGESPIADNLVLVGETLSLSGPGGTVPTYKSEKHDMVPGHFDGRTDSKLTAMPAPAAFAGVLTGWTFELKGEHCVKAKKSMNVPEQQRERFLQAFESCDADPMFPGCPQYCRANPSDLDCAGFCFANYFSELQTCEAFCAADPTSFACSRSCEAEPFGDICASFCDFDPVNDACGGACIGDPHFKVSKITVNRKQLASCLVTSSFSSLCVKPVFADN